MSIPVRSPIRLIDPRGQRFGAGLSAIVLAARDRPRPADRRRPRRARARRQLGARHPLLRVRPAVAGDPHPASSSARRAPPEPEVGPRFAQALGTTFVGPRRRPARGRPPPVGLAADRGGRGAPDAARRDRLLPRLPAVRAPVVGPRAVRPVRPPASAGRRRGRADRPGGGRAAQAKRAARRRASRPRSSRRQRSERGRQPVEERPLGRLEPAASLGQVEPGDPIDLREGRPAAGPGRPLQLERVARSPAAGSRSPSSAQARTRLPDFW